MGVSSIGSYGFSSYTTPLNSGPTAGQAAQQADQAQQAQQQNRSAEESRETTQQQARESENRGNVTATRGQNLNISV